MSKIGEILSPQLAELVIVRKRDKTKERGK